MSTETILFTIAVILSFYVAWNIGANDVANAMGTSVGSGALTLKKAIFFAAILEFSGAYFLGSNVSETIETGIINEAIFSGSPHMFVYGMLSALLAAGVWLQIASFFGWPVSTTHSLIGAVLGFGIVIGGVEAVYWDEVFFIATSWILSPIISGLIAFGIFNLLKHKIFYSHSPLKAAKKLAPFLIFFIFTILTLVMVFKGLQSLHLDLSFFPALGIAVLVGLTAAVIGHFLVKRVKNEYQEEGPRGYPEPHLVATLNKSIKHLQRAKGVTVGDVTEEISDILSKIGTLTASIKESPDYSAEHVEYKSVERIFGYLQIISACFMAFAHGANDVANAIGPLTAVVNALRPGIHLVTDRVPVPAWMLALGGLGIVIGLATWGWRVIETIGKKITELTPTRGFAAEFGAATTIVFAAKLGLPISTTHSLVGAVLGVGLGRGISAINIRSIWYIGLSWLVTIPAGAILAIIFYHCFDKIF